MCICFYIRIEKKTFSASFTAQTQWNPFYGIFFIVQVQCTMCNLYIFFFSFLGTKQKKKRKIPNECDERRWMQWMTQSVVSESTVFVGVVIPLRNNWYKMRFNPAAERRDHNIFDHLFVALMCLWTEAITIFISSPASVCSVHSVLINLTRNFAQNGFHLWQMATDKGTKRNNLILPF